jgi:hypothetical protein
MVLETTWGTATGWIVVRDVLLIGPWHHTDQRSTTHRRSPTDSEAAPRPAADASLLQLDDVSLCL